MRARSVSPHGRLLLDAQIEVGVRLGGVNEERRGLLAALVTACRFASFERRDQPFREGELAARIGDGGIAYYRFIGEHVARDRIAVAREHAAPIDAGAAGVLADASLGV